MTEQHAHGPAPRGPLPPLPPGLEPATLTPGDRDRLVGHWHSLQERGFALTPHRDSLEIRHPQCAFEAVVHLSGADDLGERRELFRALRAAFGGWAERWLPWLVQSSPAVADAYQDIKEVVEICQALRHRRS